MTWFLAALSLVGTHLNVKKDRRGFYFWVAGNTGWIIINLSLKQYAQAAMFACYLAQSIQGLVTWGKTSAD